MEEEQGDYWEDYIDHYLKSINYTSFDMAKSDMKKTIRLHKKSFLIQSFTKKHINCTKIKNCEKTANDAKKNIIIIPTLLPL